MPFERWLHVIRMRLRALARGSALDRDLDEELQWHVEQLTAQNVARGMEPDAARRAALVSMGGVELRKEECRDQRRVRLIADAVQDIGYAVRTLRRAPAFSVAALLTLTLGIGASVAMFTVVNGVLLRPLPFPHPERLFTVAMSPRSPFIREPVLSDRNYLALARLDHGFEALATFSTHRGSLSGIGDPDVVNVAAVTTGFLAVAGVAPAAGRDFAADEGEAGREPVVIIGDALWRSKLGADPRALGQQITVDGQRRTIVGVMPAGFDFPAHAAAWTPRTVTIDPGNSLMFPVAGRLRPDVTFADARARFAVLSTQLPNQPDREGAWQVGLFPLKDYVVGDIRRPLQIFSGAVVFVLLIACANVANLLLARASQRQREIAVRAALGAGRARLIRQLLTESTFLALVGGAGGVLLARWTVPALVALAPEGRIPRAEMIEVNTAVVLFALGASLLTGLVFGLVPAWRATRRHRAEPLAPGIRTFGAGQERLRRVLVVGEIAIALILLTGAGLMLKSFLRLRAVEPGFNPENAITLNLDLPGPVYSNAERLHAFHQDLLARLESTPDVVAAGLVNWRPLGDMHISGDFRIDGAATPDFNVDKPAVSRGYFAAMGIRLLQGREFQARDNATGAPVAIVSRAVAKALDRGEQVVGKRVSLRSQPRSQDWLTIVGVVEDVRQWGPAQEARPAIYQPFLQVRQPMFLSHMSYVLRTASDPARAVPAIRAALRAVDKDQPATSIALMSDVMQTATAEPGFHARLLGTFAVLALLLAVVGTYGVLAYSVAQRTHEIGVRMALGARARSIVWMVVSRTLVLAAAGVLLGTLGAMFATRLLTAFLFETTPGDPVTFAAVAVTMFAAALAAGVIPARRATRVDPLVALRHE